MKNISYIPNVVETDGKSTQTWDLYSRLLKDRIIFLGTDVNSDIANSLVAQMLFLQKADPKADIHFYINSPGGCVTSGMAILDVMNLVSCDVATYGIGMSASMGALLLTAGTKGKRFILEHSTVMIHQPSSGVRGQASEIEIEAREILKWKKLLNKILAKNTGQTVKEIEKSTDRDTYFIGKEAVKYGLVDKLMKG